MPTGEFSVSGGYSTARRLDGRTQRRRTQSARPGAVSPESPCNTASTPVASNCRSPSRSSWAIGLASASTSTCKQTLATNYISYDSQTVGIGTAGRICAERRAFVPGPLQHLFAENHAAVSVQQLSVARHHGVPGSMAERGVAPRAIRLATPTAKSSLAVRKELAAGAVLVSMLGYTVAYNTLDNNRTRPRPLRRVQAGLRRHRRRRQFHPLDRRRAQLLRDVLRRRQRAASAGAVISPAGAAKTCACWITSRWARTWSAASRRPASGRAT